MRKHLFSIEREALVLDKQTNKPIDIDKDFLCENMVLDFASNQIEYFPTLCKTLTEMKSEYERLTDRVKEKYNMWPLSQPYAIDYEVKPSSLTKEQHEYRKYLMSKYSLPKLLLSGIHYNFSFDDDLLDKKYNDLKNKELYNDFQDFKNNLYFRTYKSMLRALPLLVYLNSFTPLVTSDYDENIPSIGKNKGFEYSMSIRNSIEYGYSNSSEFKIKLDSLDDYLNSLKEDIDKGILKNLKEDYTKVRLKSKTQNIFNKDIRYIELRMIDINPFFNGIDIDNLRLITLLLEANCNNDYDINYEDTTYNVEQIALNGLDPNLEVKIDDKLVSFKDFAVKELEKCYNVKNLTEEERKIIDKNIEIVKDSSKHLCYKMRNYILENDLSIDEFGNMVMRGELDGIIN